MSSDRSHGSGDTRGHGEKRGRDRRDEAGPSNRPDKVQRKNPGADKKKKREEFYDQIDTRPEYLQDKSVQPKENETSLNLVANYFAVSQGKETRVWDYRVDFAPVIDQFDQYRLRRTVVGQLRTIFGTYVYDGQSQLYLMKSLADNPSIHQITLRDGSAYTVTLRNTREIRFTEAAFSQVINLVLRNGMRGLNLALVGRNFYDPKAEVRFFFSEEIGAF